MSEDEFAFDPNEPDTTDGDFYCKICDVIMNSTHMWSSHITGRKHIKKILKGPRVIYKRKFNVDNEEEDDYDIPSKMKRFDDRSNCFESPAEISHREHGDRYYDAQWLKRNFDTRHSPYISDKERFYPSESERCFSGGYMPDRPDVYFNTGRLFEHNASFDRFDGVSSLGKSEDRCDFLAPIVKDYGHKSIESHIDEIEFMDKKARHSFPLEETQKTGHGVVGNERVLDTTAVANIIDEMFKERFSSNTSAEKDEPFYPEMNLDPVLIKKALDEHFKLNNEKKYSMVNEENAQTGNNTTDTLQKVISNLFNQQKETNYVNSFVKQIQQRINSVAAAHQNVSSNKNELQKVISDIIGVKVNKDLISPQQTSVSVPVRKTVSYNTNHSHKSIDDETVQKSTKHKMAVHGEHSNDAIAYERIDNNPVPYDRNKNSQSMRDDRVTYKNDYNSRDHRRIDNRSVAHQRMRKNSISERGKANRVPWKREDDSGEYQIPTKDLHARTRQKDDWASKVDDFIHKKLDKYPSHDSFSEKSKRKSNTFRRRHSSSSSNDSSSSSSTSSSSSKNSNSSKQKKKYCKFSNNSNPKSSLTKLNEKSTAEPLVKKSSNDNQKSFKESLMKDNDLSKICINELHTKKLNKVKLEEINPDNLEPEDVDSLLSSYLKPKELASDTKAIQASFEALSAKSFLQIVLKKLDNLDLNGMEELNMLTQIIAKAQILLCRKLPPRLLAALNQKMSQSGSKNVLSSLCAGQVFPSKPSLQTAPGHSSVDKIPISAANQSQSTFSASNVLNSTVNQSQSTFSASNVLNSTVNQTQQNTDKNIMNAVYKQMFLSYCETAKLSQIRKLPSTSNSSQLSSNVSRAALSISSNLLHPTTISSSTSVNTDLNNEYLSSSQSSYPPVSFTSTATSTSKNISPSLSEIKQSISHQSNPCSSLSSKIGYSPVIQQAKSSSTVSKINQFTHQTKPSSAFSSSTKYSSGTHKTVPSSIYASGRHSPVKQEKISFRTGITSSFGKQAKSNSLSFAIKHSVTKPLTHNSSKEWGDFFTK